MNSTTIYEDYTDLSDDYFGKHNWNPLPHRARIPANFTANHLITREKKVELLQKNHVVTQGTDVEITKTIEELSTCLESGSGGLDLTFDQESILLGIATLFTKYEAILEVECTKNELFAAAGCDNPSGGQRKRLEEALVKMADDRFPIYWVERDKDGRRFKWITYDALIKLAYGIEQKYSNVGIKPSKERFTHFKISYNSMFIGDWAEGYRLFESSICKEIREYRSKRNKRPSKYDIRFFYLLIGENRTPLKRNYLKIARNPMLMEHYIKQRKYKFIRNKLNDIYQMYKDLGYLLGFQIEQKGSVGLLDVFYLNPERFHGLRTPKKRKEKKR
jgi:hypothetical protein